ncbi:MAG: hypothetical protein Q8K26_05425, partial [Candidatus Gracilibacteria bacterium]|nr:hypothetical protein [Candidatus Gracilibacteria bacterium]
LMGDANKRIVCPDGQRKFGELGCQDKELVAFAPYDHQSSLSGSLGMFTGTKGQNLLSGQATMNAVNKYVPDIASSGSFVSGGGTSTCTMPSDTEKSSRLNNLRNILGMSFFEDYGLFRVSQAGVPETRGAYVDNCGTDSYLKYNLSPLGLKDKFAIEMSVRGSALKRNDSLNYTLFKLGNSYLNINTYVSDGGRRLKITNNGVNLQKIYINDLINSLQDNKFYRVIVEYKVLGVKIYIYDGNQKILESIASTGTNFDFGTLNYLYVGVEYNGSYINQWNDIIDYVKIYKK